MSQGLVIDIGPKNRTNQNGIKCTTGNNTPPGYTSYEYTQNPAAPFELTGLSYNHITLSYVVVTSISGVTKVTTYFKGEGTLLAIYIGTEDRQRYFTNTDANKRIGSETVFAEFITYNKKALPDTDLEKILDEIDTEKSFDYDGPKNELKDKLWKSHDILFDLSNGPNKKYKSDVTGKDVVVSQHNLNKVSEFVKVDHYPGDFTIKGIKLPNKGDMKINGGFPDDTLTECYAYYATSDGQYKKPLMITLKIAPKYNRSNTGYIPSIYYITKTDEEGTGTWSRLRIDGSILKDEELGEMLKIIKQHHKLIFLELNEKIKNKLKDNIKNLTIDLTGKFSEDKGTYISNGMTIHYEKKKIQGCTMITHAYTLQIFTVKRVKFDEQHFIDRGPLIPQANTLINKFISYHYESAGGTPLLICMYYDNGNRWIQRHNGDTTWTILTDGAPQSDIDGKISSLIKKLAIPKIALDLSRSDGRPYRPENNTLKFTVSKNEDPSQSGFYRFTHNAPGSIGFIISCVTYNSRKLTGIMFNETLCSLSAFYLWSDTTDMNKLLLIELVIQSTSKRYKYFERSNIDSERWTPFSQKGGEFAELSGTFLTAKLEELKKRHTDTIPESSTSEEMAKSSSYTPDSSSLSAGAIAGIVVGSIIGACVCGIIGWKLTPVVRGYITRRHSSL